MDLRWTVFYRQPRRGKKPKSAERGKRRAGGSWIVEFYEEHRSGDKTTRQNRRYRKFIPDHHDHYRQQHLIGPKEAKQLAEEFVRLERAKDLSLHDLLGAKSAGGSRWTMVDLFQRAIEDPGESRITPGALAESTQELRKAILEEFCKYMITERGRRYADEITTDDLIFYQKERFINRGVKWGRHFQQIRRAFAFGIECGKLVANPYKPKLFREPAPKAEDQRSKRFSEKQLQEAFRCLDEGYSVTSERKRKGKIETLKQWQEARPELADYCRFLLYTGLRPGEALGITWNDVKFRRGKNALLTVRPEISKTKGRKAPLPLNPRAEEILRRRGKDKTGIEVFPYEAVESRRKKEGTDKPHERARKNAQRFIKPFGRVMQHLGYSGKSLRNFRHTFITMHAHADGWTALKLMTYVGHSTIKMTEAYYHPDSKMLESDVDVFGDTFESKSESA